MTVYYKTLIIKTHAEVYEPGEDSFLLADNLKVKKGDQVLDMGTGTGIQALAASKDAAGILAVDINPMAIEAAKENAEANNAGNITFRLSDLFAEIKESEKFDLIIFNPPYVPSDEKDLPAKAWAGGVQGREVIDRFIEEAPGHLKEGGRIQLLISSLNELEGVKRKLTGKGFIVEVTARKRIWFEELYVLTARKKG